MSALKFRSNSNRESPKTTATNSSTTTETVIERPAFSYCHLVTLAVAIIAVVVGAYYLTRETASSSSQIKNDGSMDKINRVKVSGDKSKSEICKENAKNKREKGLVFYWNIITEKEVNNGFSVYGKCVDALGGQHRAEMLQKWFIRLSETKKLFIIQDVQSGTKQITENFIRLCMTSLSIWQCFVGMYVWSSYPEPQLWQIKQVIKEKAGLDTAKVQFISSNTDDLLKKYEFKVIEVNPKIEESDFEKIMIND